ncbi:hypothetical protein [Halorhodospira halochloris]|uniref:hypothetical protein n=1 Tax=Halorhodospira halochloris TaxID=1052 RepID=UPI001EE7CC4E|nr:hypothetical protein [Halorhodospira halochloris]MCG5548230.1 hypothetical protein [Halorhodospira halochloris]
MSTEQGQEPLQSGSAKGSRDPGQIRERLVWRAAVLMLLAVTGWLFYVAFDAQERAEELEQEVLQLGEIAEVDISLGFSSEAIDRFEAAGIEQAPDEHLFADLEGKSDWLAESSNLDGDIEIVRDKSLVLTDHWALVKLDTDHGEGKALLSFSLADDGAVEWQMLANTLDRE